MIDGRDDHLVDEHGLLPDAEDVRDRVAVDIRVEQADLLALLRERDREVRGKRRLPDAALAAANREHTRRSIEREPFRALLHPTAQLRRQRLALLGRHDIESERNALDARNVAEDVGHLLLERVAQRTARDRERNRDANVAAVDVYAADHVELGHRALQLGIDYPLERLEDQIAARLAHGSEPSLSNFFAAAASGRASANTVANRSPCCSIRCSATSIVKSRGRTAGVSSSQRSGVDTGAPGFGRTL